MLFIGTAPYVVSTHPQKPYKTLADVIAAAKAKPDSISYASVGSGSIGHLAMVLLSKQAGVRLVHVPYRGGGPAMNDAVAGHVDLLIGSTALSVPQIQAGAIRAVMQTGKTRSAALAQVPTVAEAAIPGFEAYAWWGLFAPAGTPKPIIERFGREFAASSARSASPRCSPRRSRSISCSADPRSCASSLPTRCVPGAQSCGSTTSRAIDRTAASSIGRDGV